MHRHFSYYLDFTGQHPLLHAFLLRSCKLSSAGSCSGICAQASRFLLYEERAQLVGWPNARKQEEKGGRQKEKRKRGTVNIGSHHF